ncbi:MAG TPA: hypothetical protein VF079_06365 [Sphingomicrobium sp.]
MGWRLWWWGATGVALGVAAGLAAWASWDPIGPPLWGLAKTSYDSGGSAAMLLPSNDTRVNLYLLLADRRGAVVRDPHAKAEALPLVVFPWSTMAAKTYAAQEEVGSGSDDAAGGCNADSGGAADCWKAGSRREIEKDEWGYPTRCQSNETGEADFIASVQANARIPEGERAALIAARQDLKISLAPPSDIDDDVECGISATLPAELPGVSSPSGREFGSYLQGARAFYAGQFGEALARFGALSNANDAWVRETSLYMVGRTHLNAAIERSIDEYGSLVAEDKRDRKEAVMAGAAFTRYLGTYPDGRYASSARGLMRRVHWVAGDTAALANDYGAQISARRPYDGVDSDLGLVEEVDQKLAGPVAHPADVRDPVLLAVIDLQRMRRPTKADRTTCCGPPITRADIDRQRAYFGKDSELYDYVRAAEAYFVRHQPREVLRLIPDAAHQERFTYLQFSRQMLRGMALQDAGDGSARAFWLSLFHGAVQPYQAEAVELALAMHDEQTGRLDLVFAPDSRVRHPIMRELLLEHIAGPDILREQASRPGVPPVEKEIALYILLSKELRNGLFRDFANDLRLLPKDAKPDEDNPYRYYFGGATSYYPGWDAKQERPPLDRFGPTADLGDGGCPALTVTASQLGERPRAIRPRLCLAEYFRANGFDDFDDWNGFDDPVKGGGLGSSRSLFPAGKPYSRLEVYKSIIADSTASADEKAWALNRAVQCYAPVGNNSCGGTEVSLSVRRGWFRRLKAQYPKSSWADDLAYYW